MNMRVFIHTENKRTETTTLLDSGATENFMSEAFARRNRIPFKTLKNPRTVQNVDGTMNKQGAIHHYTDLEVQCGQQRKNMRFFLTSLGDLNLILGYPWFAAIEPKIQWGKGWLDYSHLPIVLRTTNVTEKP